MKNKITLLLFLFLSSFVFSQEEDNLVKDIPFAIIDKVPVYPGCGVEDNKTLKKCMSEKISAHVSRKFKRKLLPN